MKLNYTTSPHLRGKDTTARLMLDVVLALLPALIAAVAGYVAKKRLTKKEKT